MLGLATACGGSSDPLTRIEAQFDSTVATVCRECPAAASGATTEAECLEAGRANNPFTGEGWECQRRAYEMYPNELGPMYDCQADVLVQYDRCIRNALTTCPPDADTGSVCGEQLSASTRACPQTDSVAAGTALAECFRDD